MVRFMGGSPVQKFHGNWALTNANIDVISTKLHDYLQEIDVDQKQILRLCLSVEDVLWQWQVRLSENAVCAVTGGTRLGRPFVELQVVGERVNPYEKADAEFSDLSISENLLANLGLSPAYYYDNGVNRLVLQPRRKKLNPVIPLVISIVLAVIIGEFCLKIVDPLILRVLSQDILTPLFDAFMRLMGLLGGVIIFFSMLWGIVGIGDMAFLSTVGKRLVGRALLWTFVTLVATMVVALWFYPVDFYGAVNGTGIVKQLWKLLLDIVPGDIASPFLKGNSLQIIFLAVCSGIIMLMLGKQTENVLTDVGQINNIVLTGMNSVSVLTPYIVFVCVLNMIICGINIPTSLLLKIFLLAWGVEFLVQIYFTLRLAYKGHVSPSLIFKKLLPTYIIAFSTGSSAAAFSSNSRCCNKELGISQKLTDLGIPLMQAMFKPGAAIAYMVLSLTMAEMYSVPINPSWLLVAIIMSGMLSMAGQPSSAGGDVISLTILCLQLGIPMEALVLAIPLDQLLDFKGTATSVWSGMAGLGIVADSVGMLKQETLKKEI